jgi:S-adenosylmethionine-diacylgycerolhomoserine-N-methlytransferase
MDPINGGPKLRSLAGDLETLYHVVLKRMYGASLQERLDNFYKGQELHYDSFRQQLLSGRSDLFNLVPVNQGDVWVDMGGGTGATFEALGPKMTLLKKAYVIDLCEPLLSVAQQRKKHNGWDNLEVVHGDAVSFAIPNGQYADAVSFSYSLTMMPQWFAAIDHAVEILKPGGYIAVCDFFIGHPFRISERQQPHNWATRTFWRIWFEIDGVFPSSDHVPYLTHRFQVLHYGQHRAKLPYLPFASAPYYLFLGKKAE